ncbi:KilA-N domain-containing protein [Desulfoplanes sp. PS50]
MKKNRDIEVLDTRVTISRMAEEDYISLTDIARHRDADRSDDLIRNWVRNRNTLEFLGIWEKIHNPNFNSVEFDGFRMQAGLNSFTLTPKQWITRTNAKGIVSKAGRLQEEPLPIGTSPLSSHLGYPPVSGKMSPHTKIKMHPFCNTD